jgi:PAS domain S-box-containing protein
MRFPVEYNQDKCIEKHRPGRVHFYNASNSEVLAAFSLPDRHGSQLVKGPEIKRNGGLEGALGSSLVMDNIIQAIADGVMVIGNDGTINLVNLALCGILGMEQSELLGKGWGELFIDGGSNLEFSQTVVEVIQTGQVFHNAQVPYTSPDGREKQLITTTSLIKNQDQGLVGVVAVFKDITEIKMLHQREHELLANSRKIYEERQEGLDRIARAVAHEMRNPVTAIGGLAARLMRKTEQMSPEAEYYRNIMNAAAELEQIVSEVRKYAEIRLSDTQPVELDSWLKDLLKGYAARARQQGVVCSLKSSPGLRADLDPELMALAIGNLLDNALDAMPRGGELNVELKGLGRDSLITITDTGGGIPAEDMPYLFDPFHTTKADRVGMSLAISNRIVFEHKAELKISGGLGEGVTCRVILPPARQVKAKMP